MPKILKPKEVRKYQVPVLMNEAEKKALIRAAKAEKISVSKFLREAAITAIKTSKMVINREN